MRKLLFLCFILFTSSAFGQLVQFPTNYGVGYRRTGGDTLLWVPKDTINPGSQLSVRSHIAIKGGSMYYWNGSKWSVISSNNSTDTTSLSNRINTKLNISDTGSMLTNYKHWTQGYLKGIDTVILSNRIDTRVPYTGATQDVNLGTNGLFVEHVNLNTGSVDTSIGRLSYDTASGTIQFGLKGGNVTLQIGQEEVILVRNNTGSTLTDGQMVYITGSTGEVPTVELASNGSEITSSVTIGMVTESIAHGANGFVTITGLVHGLNTNALTEGAALWLGSTVGSYTQVKPTAPAHSVLVGYVVKKSGGNGSILVKVQNGYELDELHDVLLADSPSDKDILYFDSGLGVWRNGSVMIDSASFATYFKRIKDSFSVTNPIGYLTKTTLIDSNNVLRSSTALKLNITDTSGKWVTSVYRKIGSDSVFYIKNGTSVFAFKDSTGGASASPAGNYGNLQINRNGSFATPATDSLNYSSASGLVVKNKIRGSAAVGGDSIITHTGFYSYNSAENAYAKLSYNGGSVMDFGGIGGLRVDYYGNSHLFRSSMAIGNPGLSLGTGNIPLSVYATSGQTADIIKVMDNTSNSFLSVGNTGTVTVNNSNTSTSDFLVKGQTDNNLLWADASADEVYIGTNTDNGAYKLQVNGASYFNGNIVLPSTKSLLLQSGLAEIKFSTLFGSPALINQVSAGYRWVITDNGPSGAILDLVMGSYPSYNNSTFKVNGTLVVNDDGNAANDVRFESDNNANHFFLDASADALGINQGTPTAQLHIGAGAAGAGKAPLKFTSGTLMTTPEVGALEFENGLLYLDSSNSNRDTVATRDWVGSSSLMLRGTTTPVGRLELPMGEISYFNTTGTTITISGTSDGTTNMVKDSVVTTLSSMPYEFDMPVNGRLRYTGTTSKMFHIAVTASFTPATANDIFVLGVAKNKSVITASKVLGSSSGTQFSSLHIMVMMNQNDYLELYIGNTSGTRNITAKTLNIFAMGL